MRVTRMSSETGKEETVYYCDKCDMDMSDDMEHCEDCDVCVYEYDHHCVFFSKCIAGGNIWCFYGSIAMLIVNFIVLGIFVVIDTTNKTTHPRRNHHVKHS